MLHLKRTLPCAANIQNAELGIEPSEELMEIESDGHSAHSAIGEEEVKVHPVGA